MRIVTARSTHNAAIERIRNNLEIDLLVFQTEYQWDHTIFRTQTSNLQFVLDDRNMTNLIPRYIRYTFMIFVPYTRYISFGLLYIRLTISSYSWFILNNLSILLSILQRTTTNTQKMYPLCMRNSCFSLWDRAFK